MDNVWQVKPTDKTKPELITDNAQGGQSKAKYYPQSQYFDFECEIKTGLIAHAYCGVFIPVYDWTNSVYVHTDEYQYLELDIEHNSTSMDNIAIFLINQHDATNEQGEKETRNLQFVHYHYPQPGRQSVRIPLSKFDMPAWSAFYHHKAGVDVSKALEKINFIQVLTGDAGDDRKVKIKLHSIKFTGKWIATNKLYLSIIIVWGVIVFLHLIGITFNSLEKLRLQNKKNASLNKLNRQLLAQASHFENLALYDELTGLLNRKGLSSVYERAIRAYLDGSQAYAMILIDIDHFKKINDNYGHDVGDEALKNVARTIQQQLRAEDTIARWGGEEMIVITPVFNLQAACALAERIREQIEKTRIINNHVITASFGVAMLDSDDIDVWFKQADFALYQAKHNGRNRVETGETKPIHNQQVVGLRL
ncbi:GGDEF domain-containing protein [Catenovulum agarivorans]|uniref:GGDEF domain-containing protein n=1 Tax=Catenovulum agarivorans TaxID=1172192 RepID=UPI000320026C|nr:GGDEF domain-containing protein [Catenovulum agarivorans]